MSNTNFTTLTNIISTSTSQEQAIKQIERNFKKLGPSGAKNLYLDAKDLAEGKMSESEFMHNFTAVGL